MLQTLNESLKKTRAYRIYRQSLLYDTVRYHGKVVKRAIRLPRYLGTEYQCPICGVGLRAFKPIGKSYWRDTKKFGVIHPASSIETFNVAAANCPRCDASDRSAGFCSNEPIATSRRPKSMTGCRSFSRRPSMSVG